MQSKETGMNGEILCLTVHSLSYNSQDANEGFNDVFPFFGLISVTSQDN